MKRYTVSTVKFKQCASLTSQTNLNHNCILFFLTILFVKTDENFFFSEKLPTGCPRKRLASGGFLCALVKWQIYDE
jgi:hypothetical protein